jgi:hypothetical protein
MSPRGIPRWLCEASTRTRRRVSGASNVKGHFTDVMGWVTEALRQSHSDAKGHHDAAITRLQAEYNRLQSRVDAMYVDKLDGRIDAAFFDGRERGNPAPFANTNTGWLGLTVRGILRRDKDLRKWAYAKIDVTAPGYTVVRLKPNPNPTREKIDSEIFPKRDFGPHGTRWRNF